MKKLVKLRNLSFMYDELWIKKRSVTWSDNEKKNQKRIYYHQNNILEKLKPKNQNLKTILIPVIQQKIDKKKYLAPPPPSLQQAPPPSPKKDPAHTMIPWWLID